MTTLSISPDGLLIALALAEREHSMISVHELVSGRRRLLAHAHHRTIHELCWSADGERLVSASADGTSKVGAHPRPRHEPTLTTTAVAPTLTPSLQRPRS